MDSVTTEPKAASRCPFAGTSAAPKQTLSSQLREATAEAHNVAEKHPVQGRMARGVATRDEYANWLEQMYHLWSAIDASVALVASRDVRIQPMVRPYHTHAPRIEADLAFLGRTGPRRPASPGTQRLVDYIQSAVTTCSASIIGAWYVLEGSNNGGRFLAKALARGLELTGPQGLTSLDPHGEAQLERWQAWKSALDEQHFNLAERTAIIEVAGKTFAGLTPVFDDMPAVA